MLRCIVLISIIGDKTRQVHTTQLKSQTEATRTSRQKKGNLHLADANHPEEPKDRRTCCFPVHPQVHPYPDMHELHVHIHERKSVLINSHYFKRDICSLDYES